LFIVLGAKEGRPKKRERERERERERNKAKHINNLSSRPPKSLNGQIKAKKIKPIVRRLMEPINSIIEKGKIIFLISNRKFIKNYKGATQVQRKYTRETPNYKQKKI
jgi:hypothetical protein